VSWSKDPPPIETAAERAWRLKGWDACLIPAAKAPLNSQWYCNSIKAPPMPQLKDISRLIMSI
jgi:hypothetical protein